jgi:RNA polymerase sigma-70 factor (ECF subfamily)
VLLLLLVPITLYLFKKGDTAVKNEKPVVAKQKETPKELQTEYPTDQSQEPVIVHLPVYRSTDIAPDIPQSVIAQAVDSVTSDTLSNIIVQEQIVTDSTVTDTTVTMRKVEILHYDIVNLLPEKPAVSTDAEKRWSLQLAYAGQFDEQNRYNQPFSYKPTPSDEQPLPGPLPSTIIPSSIDNWMDYATYLANNPDAMNAQTRSVIMRIALNNANGPGEDKILRTVRHQMPVTWSLALKYRLNHRFGLESGLSYSRLNSDFEMGTDGNTIREQQTVHYLGIPMKGIYNMYDGKRWGIYGSVGLTTEIPIHSTLQSDFYVNGLYETNEKTTIRAPWQLSTTLGLGLQYHLTPNAGFFVEPSLQYYIPMKTDIETYRTEQQITFSLPLGIRFTW